MIDKNIKDEVNEKNKTPKEKDPRSLGDKIEDGLDEVMGSVQDFFYGENNDFTKDIPATMEKPSGIRKVNKVQTRRNFNKILFKSKFFKIILILFLIGLGFSLLITLIGFFM